MEEQNVIAGKQFVVFKIGKEEFGINIHKITTIERMMSITRVPRTPEFVKGVTSLRGEIVPIICLRKLLGLPSIEATDETRIIFGKVEDLVLGMIVDEVTEVVVIPNENIESAAGLSNEHMANYIYGVGKLEDRIVTILNLESMIENSQAMF